MPQPQQQSRAFVDPGAPCSNRFVAPPSACTSSDAGVGAAWIYVSGELDVATSPKLHQALSDVAHDTRLVVLDLRDLEFMDTTGVHLLVDAARAARREGRRLLLIRAPASVDAVFALTGTADLVDIADVDPGQPAVQALLHLAHRENDAAEITSRGRRT